MNDNKQDRERGMMRYSERPFLSLREMMDRMFDDRLDPFGRMPSLWSAGLPTMELFPKVDMHENDKEIVVTANVPGMKAEDIHIEVEDDVLSLSGKVLKESREGKEGDKCYRYEREEGEFSRRFALPSHVKKDGVVASVKNGVLSVTLPKVQASGRATITVKEG